MAHLRLKLANIADKVICYMTFTFTRREMLIKYHQIFDIQINSFEAE